VDVDSVKRVATRFIFDKVILTVCSCIWEDNGGVKVCKECSMYLFTVISYFLIDH
jgi:hypothetical protein